jgi:5-methylcytosine-specific restriction protein A
MGARGGLRVCTKPGCPALVSSGRCADHQKAADRARGNATQRGYGSRHRSKFRAKVLERDPVCVLCHARRSTDADHHPVDRRTLVLRGEDPDDPKHGRGLCGLCHKQETAANQPGGFNAGT